jgi:hypothetical protein
MAAHRKSDRRRDDLYAGGLRKRANSHGEPRQKATTTALASVWSQADGDLRFQCAQVRGVIDPRSAVTSQAVSLCLSWRHSQKDDVREQRDRVLAVSIFLFDENCAALINVARAS